VPVEDLFHRQSLQRSVPGVDAGGTLRSKRALGRPIEKGARAHFSGQAGGAISLSSELSFVSNDVSALWRRASRSHPNYLLFPMATGSTAQPRHGGGDYGGKTGIESRFESTACRTIAIGLGIQPAKAEDIPLLKSTAAKRACRPVLKLRRGGRSPSASHIRRQRWNAFHL
jgi:hypothetical protein